VTPDVAGIFRASMLGLFMILVLARRGKRGDDP
jgi:hypothetical protein